ncbi:hypothetical protein PtrSN002B_004878 [Pyrenophora tritici-repentis]|uniref:Uncharacterized protein n=2 Tax=Pyrenophora tritici-repentis TaxID=45151 RepID=A0A2W1GF70_9PLEO|nr:uncharacterized protein PTRG_10673 [Pyrenophora tritici-repentis Pt-1C-BFP]KAA8621342.1 hypothetical protein PtrV1_05843 [Pyrenophora tritici-repentis]EDU43723.1 predicted protein [Pyrenophora tritici-repentis Pt-1C-BFP]KAF7450577.1 hypothetical protein A1F99_051930 [Pyrenophora tritici-repentis]KAF7573195.1 hypothetical protein PtrM4_081000 [Pyrenophora tritici-repentis]KAG9381203.1 hypothetical protein A1F94_008523 [Pyrenophora tritici-repentis]
MENPQHEESSRGDTLHADSAQKPTNVIENSQHEEPSRDDTPQANSALSSSTLGNDVSSKAATSTSPTPIASSPSDVKTAPLETYILSTEAKISHLLPTRTTPVFRSFPDSESPTLRSDRENKIIIYCGAFNPPHAGHAALLSHTYFSTDASTIAALILPVRTLSGKSYLSNADGRNFRLTYSQRSELWQDDLLSRFSWIFPGGGHRNMSSFIDLLKVSVENDGFKISFLELSGAEYAYSLGMIWDKNIPTRITSSITRPVPFAESNGVKEPQLRKLHGCGPWEDVPQEDLRWESEEEEKPKCWPCWPCHKMRKVFPEAFDDKGRPLPPDYRHHDMSPATRPDILLSRCHAAPKLPKQCQYIYPVVEQMTREWGEQEQELDAHLLFIPSTQDPNSPTLFPEMSSTSIRKRFLKADTVICKFRDQMSEEVLNVDRLCEFLDWPVTERNVKRSRESDGAGYDDDAAEGLNTESDDTVDDSAAKRLKKESKDARDDNSS